MKTRILNVWTRWTISTTIIFFGALIYMAFIESIMRLSLAPLKAFSYPLTWIVFLSISVLASTFALAITGWQDGYDTLPIISPAYATKEVIMFPIWFPRYVFKILLS